MKNSFNKSVVVLAILILSLSIFPGWSLGTAEQEENGYLGVQKFELDVTFLNQDHLKMKYRNQNNRVYAKMERKSGQEKLKMTKAEAKEEMENLLQELALNSKMSVTEVVYSTLDVLQLTNEQLKEFELEVNFTNGKRIDIEIEE